MDTPLKEQNFYHFLQELNAIILESSWNTCRRKSEFPIDDTLLNENIGLARELYRDFPVSKNKMSPVNLYCDRLSELVESRAAKKSKSGYYVALDYRCIGGRIYELLSTC